MKLVYSRNTRGLELFPAFLPLFTTTKTFVRVENANRPLFFLIQFSRVSLSYRKVI